MKNSNDLLIKDNTSRWAEIQGVATHSTLVPMDAEQLVRAVGKENDVLNTVPGKHPSLAIARALAKELHQAMSDRLNTPVAPTQTQTPSRGGRS